MSGSGPRPRPTFKVRLSIALARCLVWCFRALPVPVAYWLADRVGDLVYHLFRTYRGNVSSNMAHVLGPSATPEEVQRVVRRVFRASSRNFADMLRVPSLSPEALMGGVTVTDESWQHLDAAVAHGRGVVLVTAHFGAFDSVGQLLCVAGYDVTGVVTRTVPEFIDTAVGYLRQSRGMPMEPATPGGIRRVVGRLKRGGIVAMLSDRDFFRSGRPVVFFGRETTLPPGPARLARDTGAVILPIFTPRRARGRELIIEEPFAVEATTDVDADVDRALARIVQNFERRIGQDPDQWVMFQRVWPERRTTALRVFPVGSPLEGEILGRGATAEGPLTRPPEPPTGRTVSRPSPSPAPAHRPGARRE